MAAAEPRGFPALGPPSSPSQRGGWWRLHALRLASGRRVERGKVLALDLAGLACLLTGGDGVYMEGVNVRMESWC